MEILAVVLLAASLCAAQQKTDTAPPQPQEDYSGMYSFLQDGEFLQITLQEGKVDGYVSRLGDLESDRGVPLDHFFKKGSLKDSDLEFTTQSVHGVSFEFKGHFERGAAKSKKEQGYYLLKGTLTQMTTDADKKTTAKARGVEFKLFPEDVEGQSSTHD
jgi:hypothetical protein